MAEITYAFATARDHDAICALLQQCALPIPDIRAHLDDFVVAQDGERLAAVVGLQVVGQAGLLRSLAVQSDYRGRRLAQALVARIVAHAHARGIAKLYLLTTTAEKFFAKLRFAVTERSTAPSEMLATEEFQSLCPATAVCMMREISQEARYFPREMLQLRPDIPGAKMWGVALQQAMLTYFEVEPGRRFDTHHHASEQITLVLDGALFFEVDGRVIRVGQGELIAVPSNTAHAVFTQELGARAVDAWAPVMPKYRVS
jgi:amino-acid N-acetyltransferase